MKRVTISLVALFLTIVTVTAEERVILPVIIGYQDEGCVKKGANVTVLGSGFGNALGLRRVVLWGGGATVQLMATIWLETQFTVRLPNDARIIEGQVYHIALQDRLGGWISNIGPALSICTPAAGTNHLQTVRTNDVSHPGNEARTNAPSAPPPAK